MKIVSCNSNNQLSEEISKYLKKPLCRCSITRFADMEIFVEILENVRGEDVFVIQSTSYPANDNLMELLVTIDALKRGSARRITAVIPYFGYARQDRKDKSRAPVSAVRKVKELVACGVDRLLLLDVHSSAVEGAAAALNTPCDHLWARPVFLDYIRGNPEFAEFMEQGFVIAAPDLNAGKFARGYAEALGNVPLVLVEKRRDPSSGRTEILNVIGEVQDKNVLIVDDLIGTGGTLIDAAQLFKKEGAKRIQALATHGVFAGKGSLGRIMSSPIEKVLVTNSILRGYDYSGVEIVSVAKLLGEAIFRIHSNQSVSSLFE